MSYRPILSDSETSPLSCLDKMVSQHADLWDIATQLTISGDMTHMNLTVKPVVLEQVLESQSSLSCA